MIEKNELKTSAFAGPLDAESPTESPTDVPALSVITASDLFLAMEATAEERKLVQGFVATLAKPPMVYIRDLNLPADQQRVWERPYQIDSTYDRAQAAMMDEIEIRGYQKALDYIEVRRLTPLCEGE